MEYQRIINLLNDTTNESSKFKTRNWVEINDESQGTYNVSYQIKFKVSQWLGHTYVIIVMHTCILQKL